MNIVELERFKALKQKRYHGLIRRSLLVLPVIVVLVLGNLVLTAPPLPSISPSVNSLNLPAPSAAIDIPWPGYGQAAIGATGYDVVAAKGAQTPVPMASVAKLVTALAVLKAKPLKHGEQGPMITITEEDIASYHNYVSQDGSVVPVNMGEQISQYQALQAMMLPSANNIAFTLAHWAFGSVADYNNYANKMVATLGLKNTRIADESGFSPGTVSTASDLVRLGISAMQDPVLAEIVGQSKAVVPVAGTISNINTLLGTDGVIGIKTGNTNEAGGCFLFAALYTGKTGLKTTIVGAIMAAPNLGAAMRDSLGVLRAAQNGFEQVKIVNKNQIIGTYKTIWGGQTDAIAGNDLTLQIWKGTKVTIKPLLLPLETPARTGASAGQVTANAGGATGAVPVVTKQAINKPSLIWRLRQQL